MYRRYFEEGDFMTYFIVDTRNLVTFVRNFTVLFSAPTTLILAQIFVFIEVGAYGLILLLLVSVSMVILIILSLKIGKCNLNKFHYLSKRISFNM